VIIGVNGESDVARETTFAREKRPGFANIVGAKKILESYGTTGFPTTIFIDAEGKVQDRQVGFAEERARKVIEKILPTPPAGDGGR
jgi:hypothetical protein